jgi:hypothetical protein
MRRNRKNSRRRTKNGQGESRPPDPDLSANSFLAVSLMEPPEDIAFLISTRFSSKLGRWFSRVRRQIQVSD